MIGYDFGTGITIGPEDFEEILRVHAPG